MLFSDEQHEIDFEARLQKCGDGPTCTAASNSAQTLIELATLFRRTLTKANEAARNAFAAQLDLLDKQWRAYLGSSRGTVPLGAGFEQCAVPEDRGLRQTTNLPVDLRSSRRRVRITQSAPRSSAVGITPAGIGGRLPMELERREDAPALGWLRYDGVARRRRRPSEARIRRPRLPSTRVHNRLRVAPPRMGETNTLSCSVRILVKFLRGRDGIRERLIGGASGGNSGSGK